MREALSTFTSAGGSNSFKDCDAVLRSEVVAGPYSPVSGDGWGIPRVDTGVPLCLLCGMVSCAPMQPLTIAVVLMPTAEAPVAEVVARMSQAGSTLAKAIGMEKKVRAPRQALDHNAKAGNFWGVMFASV